MLNYLDPASPDPVRIISGHKGSIRSMCTVNQGDTKTIYTGSFDGRICAWEVPSGNVTTVAEEDAQIENIAPIDKGILYTVQKKEDLLKKFEMSDVSAT
jgi:WD40 repeat protein